MIRIFTHTLKTLALGVVLAASVHSAQATAVAHTYVSGVGSDSNPCSRTAPCATFAAALAKTSAGGVISAIDMGDYGPVTIAKAVTIDGTGVQASIVTNASAAITINGASSDTIILRHLAITGLANSTSGVTLNSGNLVMEDCKISGFSGLFSTGLTLNSSGNVVAENTTVTGCFDGIYNNNFGLLSLRNVTLQGNVYGLQAVSGLTDISRSLITQNSFVGLDAVGSTVSASDCMVSGNSTGVYAGSGGIMRLTNNDILNNQTGGIDSTDGGVVSSTGNNRKTGNATSGSVTPGKIIAQQ